MIDLERTVKLMQVEVKAPEDVSDEEIDFLAKMFYPLVMERLNNSGQEDKPNDV